MYGETVLTGRGASVDRQGVHLMSLSLLKHTPFMFSGQVQWLFLASNHVSTFITSIILGKMLSVSVTQ